MTHKIHQGFKLNGTPYTNEELKEVAYSLIKEGEEFEMAIGDFLLDWLSNETTITVTTSGSTGKPKQLVLQKQHMVNSAKVTGDFFGLNEKDLVLHCLPTNFIAGKMMLVRAMVLGLELDYVEPVSNPLEDITKHYDFCAMIPLQLTNSLTQIEQIKTLIVGGASLSPSLKEAVQGKSTKVYETYGMTETITHVAVRRINPSSKVMASYFKTLPKVTVSKDKRDCLVIRAPDIVPKPVITNDIVELKSETEFEWLGRHDNVINSGGIKLVPERIEEKISGVVGSRFFLAGFPDEKLGEKLIMLVEGNTDERGLLQKINSIKTLDKFETPKQIHSIPKFMETANGKVDRIKTLKLIR